MNLLNRILNAPPQSEYRLTVAKFGATEHFELTEVHELSRRAAAHLLKLGVLPGSRVGVLSANRLEWVLADLAALQIKAVTAGFDPGKFDASPAELAERYDLEVIFTDREPSGERVRPIGELRDLSEPTSDLPTAEWEDHEATTLKFTSGSTGPEKALAASAGSTHASMEAVQQMFAHGTGDNIFVFLPLSLLQQRYWVYSAFVFGHDITISTHEAAFSALPQICPTVVMGVPGFFETARAHIETMAARTGRDPDEVTCSVFGDRIRYLWTGSAPANSTTLRYFTERGLPIFEGYGLNETCIVAKNHPDAYREGSVGQVLPGKEIAFDKDGMIHVRSDHPVATRYEYAQDGESEHMFSSDGTVRTNDIGYLDDDGFLFVQGRLDDVIILDNGKKVLVRPLEERLKSFPEIEDCVVLCPAQTDLVAVVSPTSKEMNQQRLDAILAEINTIAATDEQIAHGILAERFSIANGLLTSQYKPKRKEILARYQNQIDNVEQVDA